MTDEQYMAMAVAMGWRHVGMTWPNPSVGCVVVKDGQVVGRGVTARGGRPHGEPQALAQAGEAARGATVYVTLEPCCHHGKAPPCTDALIAAGVARVVVACQDLDPRVKDKGLEVLRQAGIAVTTGVMEAAAQETLRGFFMRIQHNRPWISLKVATSLDGMIATSTGHSQWITGPAARDYGHRLRATHDAIAVGRGTVLADDPSLTCRLKGLEDRSPVRVVFARDGDIPLTSTLVKTARDVPVWLMTTDAIPPDRAQTLTDHGVILHTITAAPNGQPDIRAALTTLATQGITSLLVEGGATLIRSMITAGVADQVYWFRAPLVVGADGTPAMQALGVETLDQAVRWKHRESHRTLWPDTLDVYGWPR